MKKISEVNEEKLGLQERELADDELEAVSGAGTGVLQVKPAESYLLSGEPSASGGPAPRPKLSLV